jgi:CRAL/TRIO domain
VEVAQIKNSFQITSAFVPIPRPDDPYAPVTGIVRSVLFDPEIFKNDTIIEYSLMIADYYLTNDDNMTVNGSVYIYDLSDITMNNIVHYTPVFLQRLAMLATQAMPLRVKGIHYVNSPPAVQSLFTSARSFMPAKIKQRVSYPLRNWQSLQEFDYKIRSSAALHPQDT